MNSRSAPVGKSAGTHPPLVIVQSLLGAARSYLRRCFDQQSPPRASELAYELGISRTRLNQRFLTEYEMTVSDFLKREQLVYAQHLLRATTLSATQIAYRAGFGTRRSFHRAFLRANRVTPDTYRRNKK